MSNRERIIYNDINGIVVTVPDTSIKSNPGHKYIVRGPQSFNDGIYVRPLIAVVAFQNGPIKEVGINGLQNEHLLAILIDRTVELNTQFPCEENSLAIAHMQQALELFEQRTKDRIKRQVEGQHKL